MWASLSPLTNCIIAVFQKTGFPEKLKKCKTKAIPNNSIFFKPKYNFKNKDAALRERSRFVLLFCSMYLAWEWTNKKSIYFSWFDLFVSFQLSFLHFSLYHLWLLSTTFGRQKVGFVYILSKYSIKISLLAPCDPLCGS